MSSRFLRSLIVSSCGALALSALACSSTTNPPGGGEAAGGNATGGGAGGAGGSAGGVAGAAGAGAHDAGLPMTYLFTFTTAADVGSVAVSNPSDTDKGDLGVFAAADSGPRATTSFDPAVGDPDAGSLEIQMPCDAYGQFLDYQLILPVISDMGNKTLSMLMRLDSGFSPDAAAPGAIYFYAKSGDNWDWGQGVAQTIAPTSVGQWVRYTFPMATPGAGSTVAFDPGYVKAIGIHIETGGGGVTNLPTPAVFHIDTIGYQ